MSVFITKPISGIRIEGMDIDLRPSEQMGGTYETPTDMNFEIKVEAVPESNTIAKSKPKGKCISGRTWSDPEKKTSTLRSGHRPDKLEAQSRKAKTLQLRDFVVARKEEINRKVEAFKPDSASQNPACRGQEEKRTEYDQRKHFPSGRHRIIRSKTQRRSRSGPRRPANSS